MSATTGERVLAWAWMGTVPYRAAWALQSRLAEDRRAGRLADDLVLLLEHPPVYTMGRNGEPRHVPAGPDALRAAGADYVDVDRGGSVTFHGPGQLVAYPIVDLAASFPIAAHPVHGDVVQYLRALEGALINTAAIYGVRVERRPPYTGVWAGTAKLAAIGVKLARGVTTHGVALNVCTDLRWFDRVVPCGIDGAGVASLETLGATGLTPRQVVPRLAMELARALGAHDVEADARTRALLASHAASAAVAA
jgi:lipoyl(octanoyl) transferase